MTMTIKVNYQKTFQEVVEADKPATKQQLLRAVEPFLNTCFRGNIKDVQYKESVEARYTNFYS